MSKEEQDNQLANHIAQAFPCPSIASRVVSVVVSKRPIGASTRSHYPYYKECYAKEIKPFIDGMIENKGDIVYDFATWCTEETGISKDTLYFRVHQSIRYLVERMDTPDRKYQQWRETIEFFRKKDVGIIISYRKGLNTGDGLVPRFIQPNTQMPKWRERLDKWLENDEDMEPFNVENLALDQVEIRQLKIELAGIKTIMADIQCGHIKILKTN